MKHVLSTLLATGLIFSSALAPGAETKASKTLGEDGEIPISVVRADGRRICPSFSFGQVPGRPELFLGKIRSGDEKDPCNGPQGLGLFQFNWETHVMTFERLVLQPPLPFGAATLTAAYDPTVEAYDHKLWVSFECGGPHIAGASACVAPLAPDFQVDVAHLSIPVSGEDANPKSGFGYSASTPKLLEYKDRLYLFWSAIRSDKSTGRWVSQEERGVELALQPGGTLMAKSSPTFHLPSHAPSRNFAVLSPPPDDPQRDASADTEGFFKTKDGVIAVSSVGGHGPDGKACLKPHDDVPGCYRLEISRATGDILSADAFQADSETSLKTPANPMEYPRIVTGPDRRTYLMAVVHPVFSKQTLQGAIAIAAGYALIPLSITDLRFTRSAESRHGGVQ